MSNFLDIKSANFHEMGGARSGGHGPIQRWPLVNQVSPSSQVWRSRAGRKTIIQSPSVRKPSGRGCGVGIDGAEGLPRIDPGGGVGGSGVGRGIVGRGAGVGVERGDFAPIPQAPSHSPMRIHPTRSTMRISHLHAQSVRGAPREEHIWDLDTPAASSGYPRSESTGSLYGKADHRSWI